MTLESSEILSSIIVDAHQKIALQALHQDADYLRHPLTLLPPPGAGLPDALLGRVAIVFASIMTASRPVTKPNRFFMFYDRPHEAEQAALKQWDYYQRLADSSSQVWLLRDAAELQHVLETWREGTPLNVRRQGLVLALNGADPIREPRHFDAWYERGVRCVGLAYSSTQYSGNCKAHEEGLTRQGYALLDVLADYKVIVDLARISQKGYYQVLDHYDGPLLVSHARLEDRIEHVDALNARAVRRLAERGGVVALLVYPFAEGLVMDDSCRLPLRAMAQLFDTVCQWTGSSAHVAIGSNLASGFPVSYLLPAEIDTIGDLWKLRAALEDFGFSAADVTAILAGNLIRLLQQVLS